MNQESNIVEAPTIQETSIAGTDTPFHPEKFDDLWRWAKAFSTSSLVPPHFRQRPEDCFVALQMAYSLKINPLTCLQNIFVIHGRPGMSSSLAIALANASGAFAGPIRYRIEGSGADLSVTAYAPTFDGEIVENTVTMAMAMKEGWTKNSKYKSIPEQMLRFRAAKWLINTTCPQVLFGLDISPPGSQSDAAPKVMVETAGPSTHVEISPLTSLNESLKDDLPISHSNRVGEALED